MTTAQTVCLLCFVLLLGSAHCKKDPNKTLDSGKGENNLQTTPSSSTDENNKMLKITTDDTTNTTSKMESTTSASNCVCTPTPKSPSTPKSTPNPPETRKDALEHYIISLPKETAILVLVVLVVACITLLLITLLCTCHVCHLRAVITRLQPYHSVDLYSVKKRSESPCKDDGKEKEQPTETCLMLAEVTVQEEEKKEEKEEESVPLNTEPPAEKPNGDVTQEENAYDIVSDEPAVGITEVSDTGV